MTVRVLPDLNTCIVARYEYNLNPKSKRDIRDDMSLLSSLTIGEELELENVGRCASLINLYFDSTPHPEFYSVFDAYVFGFHAFVRSKNIVDEQQWTAFYHIIRHFYTEVDVDPDIFPLIRDAMFGRTPPFWFTDKTRIQVLTLQCMFDKDMICI